MSTKKILLIILIVLIVLIGLSYWSGKMMSKLSFSASAPKAISDGSWLRLNPTALVPDYNEIMPMNMFGSKGTNSLESMTRKIKHAAVDKRIKGILIEPSFLQMSLPSVNELGLALSEFKKSGKPVIAFGDNMSQADYLLASYADEVYMEPSASAGIMLTGTSANIMFYKELLDKLGIKMHIIQSGEFKGAGEPYSQTSLSEGTRQNIEAALSDRFDLILKSLALRRSLTEDDVRAVFNNRDDFVITASNAKELKLVDHVLSRTAMLDTLKLDSEKLVAIADYSTPKSMPKGNKIAVLYLSGNIMPNTGNFNQSTISHAKVKKMVEQIVKDSTVKAAVLRIDSPGGSALESELIYQELLKLKPKMPIVVSMGGVAASGGYYISCAANKVVADEGTITGSIGVIMMLPETTGLGKKIGIRSQTIKFGKYAGAFNAFEPVSPQLIESLKRSSTGTYNEFKSRVMSARGITPDKINSIAEGRVYSAEDALAVNLIDEIGSLETAISQAANLASVTKYEVQNYPRKISFFDAIKDSDILKMYLRSVFSHKILNTDDLAKELFEQFEPFSWQYLMPYSMD